MRFQPGGQGCGACIEWRRAKAGTGSTLSRAGLGERCVHGLVHRLVARPRGRHNKQPGDRDHHPRPGEHLPAGPERGEEAEHASGDDRQAHVPGGCKVFGEAARKVDLEPGGGQDQDGKGCQPP